MTEPVTQPAATEALLAGLRDIHLPAARTGQSLWDIGAALWLALLAVLVLALVLRVLGHRRIRRAGPSLAETVQALKSQPEDTRRLALLRLLKTHRADRFVALRPALYRPEGMVSCDRLEGELLGD